MVVALALLIVAPLVGLSALALTAPYASVIVPPSCATSVDIPQDRMVTVLGGGSGVLLSETGSRAVVVGLASGPSPHPLTGYLLDRSTSNVLWQTRLASEAVVAAFDDGIVFLWDDKIGYAVSASSGHPLGALVRSDDYRGIFTVGGSRRLQLDAEVSAIGLSGAIFSYHAFPLAGIVDGCLFGAPGG